MATVITNVFLACSFRDEDTPINDMVKELCDALGMHCVNVAKAYTKTPPDKASEYISKAMALIAVITRRKKIKGRDEYMMSPSVRDEISLARSLNKPLLIFAEDGVVIDGYIPNYATHKVFSKDRLHDVGFIGELTASLYELKTEIAPTQELPVNPELHDYFSESSTSLTELVSLSGGDFYWTQSITKKLRFQRPCARPLKAGCWSIQRESVPEEAPPIEMEVSVREGSKKFRIVKEVYMETAPEIQASLHIKPKPRKGDYLEYMTKFRSKYLCPIYAEDVKDRSTLTLPIGGRTYMCFDGMVVVQPTERLKFQYRFPAGYDLTKKDLDFYVGGYTTTISHIVESEKRRANHTVVSFGDVLICNLEVDSPLLWHMYGIAWNPPHKKN